MTGDAYYPPHLYVESMLPCISSPRTMPVNLPFLSHGVTIATLDIDGNVTIRVDQPKENERIEMLVRVLRDINSRGGLGYAMHSRIDDVLASAGAQAEI